MSFKKLTVQAQEISLFFQERGEYICLTDMARGIEGEPGEHIRTPQRLDRRAPRHMGEGAQP